MGKRVPERTLFLLRVVLSVALVTAIHSRRFLPQIVVTLKLLPLEKVVIAAEFKSVISAILIELKLFGVLALCVCIAAIEALETHLQIPIFHLLNIADDIGHLPPVLQTPLVFRRTRMQQWDKVFIHELHHEVPEFDQSYRHYYYNRKYYTLTFH